MQYFFHQHINGRKSHLASTQEFNKLQDWCKKGWVLLYYRLTVFSTTAVGVALVDLEKPWITLICKVREENVEGTRSILWKLCDSYSKWVKRETNDRTWLLLITSTFFSSFCGIIRSLINILRSLLLSISSFIFLFRGWSSFIFYFSFNFSCCKAHDFCELDLVQPAKCGGNFFNLENRFEYNASTDTCSKCYQMFLLCNILVMFCRCVFHVAQVLSSYFSSQSPVSFQSRDMKKIELDREHVRVFLENFQWQEHSDLTSFCRLLKKT